MQSQNQAHFIAKAWGRQELSVQVVAAVAAGACLGGYCGAGGAAALKVNFFRFRRNEFSREGDDSAGMGNGGMLVYVAALLGFVSKHQLLLIRQRPEQAAGERQDEGLRVLEGAWQKPLVQSQAWLCQSIW